MGAYKHAKTECSILPLLPPLASGQYLCLRGRPRAGEAHAYGHKRAQKPTTDLALAAGDAVFHQQRRGRSLRGAAVLTAAIPEGSAATGRNSPAAGRGHDGAARGATARPGQVRKERRAGQDRR